jgi:predicted NAD-dependent protein-ADP-ribosyltransferase YbiA (DUF1768 family)
LGIVKSKTKKLNSSNSKNSHKKMDYIYFFSGKKAFRCLSNFWENDVVIDGRVYQSGEHAFHGEKFFRLGLSGVDRSTELMDYAAKFMKPSSYTPAMAKKIGGKNGLRLNEEELWRWSKMSPDVQKEICQYKLQYEEVRRHLIESKGKLLIHPALRCRTPEKCIWEGKYVDGAVIGKNLLGNIWMELRESL